MKLPVWFQKTKKEKPSPELKAIHKMLDGVPWDILSKYFNKREKLEESKERKYLDKVKKQAQKDIVAFIESAGLEKELEYSPITPMVELSMSGVTPPPITMDELRGKPK